jgi:protein-S-isoprenylcysteine O-methyltransferase Ste14
VVDTRLVPQLYSLQLVAIGLTSAGVAFAVWARIVLGEKWSARVTRKVGHDFIRTGPYDYVRHPIYSGLLLAAAGTALFVGELKRLVAIFLVLMAESFKAKREEQFMLAEFGETYEQYRRETCFLIPRFLISRDCRPGARYEN